ARTLRGPERRPGGTDSWRHLLALPRQAAPPNAPWRPRRRPRSVSHRQSADTRPDQRAQRSTFERARTDMPKLMKSKASCGFIIAPGNCGPNQHRTARTRARGPHAGGQRRLGPSLPPVSEAGRQWPPPTRYTKVGEDYIAYQVAGVSGPHLLYMPQWF